MELDEMQAMYEKVRNAWTQRQCQLQRSGVDK
jgi:hypothetical protein